MWERPTQPGCEPTLSEVEMEGIEPSCLARPNVRS